MSGFGLERERRLAPRGDRAFDPAGGSSAFVGKVTTATASIAVGSYLTVNPVTVSGAETEGGAGTLLADTSVSIPVYLVGPGTPATGDYLVCRQAGARWVAEKKGVTTPTTPMACGCAATPNVISLTSNDPTKNHGYFPNCTLTYGPEPADIVGLASGDPNWYSPKLTVNLAGQGYLPNPATGDYNYDYYLVFWCAGGTGGVPTLAIDWIHYPNTGGTQGPINYVQWTVGLHGNTCTPFLFPGTGQQAYPFSGYDTTQQITLKPG